MSFLFNIIFTKPYISYEYLNKCYNKGIEYVKIVGEEQILKTVGSIRISNQGIFEKLNNIIDNDKNLSKRISTLELMNNDLKSDLPFLDYPIICAIIIINYAIFYCIESICFIPFFIEQCTS